MKKISKLYYLVVWGIMFIPSFVDAWKPGQSIVPCGTKTTVACNFNGIIQLINNLLDVFIWLAVPISTITFAIIGWTFIVEGDKAGARSEAKNKLIALLKGLFLILAPWIIVKLIVSGLVKPDMLMNFSGLK